MIERISEKKQERLAERVAAPVAPETTRLWWLGGATFVVRTPGLVLWIDPFFGEPARPEFHRQRPPLMSASEIDPIDGVLITHEHNDHCHIPTLSPVVTRQPRLPIYAPSASSEKLARELPESSVTTVDDGHVSELADVRIRVFEGNDPLAEHGIMYLLETIAGKLLFAGDSVFTEGFFKDLKPEAVDVACFSVGGLLFGEKAYMTPEEFGKAAEEVGAKRAVPVHWDLWEEAKVDPEGVGDWGTSSLLLLQPGQGIELT